jgi:hypothetical protein
MNSERTVGATLCSHTVSSLAALVSEYCAAGRHSPVRACHSVRVYSLSTLPPRTRRPSASYCTQHTSRCGVSSALRHAWRSRTAEVPTGKRLVRRPSAAASCRGHGAAFGLATLARDDVVVGGEATDVDSSVPDDGHCCSAIDGRRGPTKLTVLSERHSQSVTDPCVAIIHMIMSIVTGWVGIVWSV